MCLLLCIFINVQAENLVSAIRLIKSFLISLNTEKLRSASADEAAGVPSNTRKIECSEIYLDLQILRISSKY